MFLVGRGSSRAALQQSIRDRINTIWDCLAARRHGQVTHGYMRCNIDNDTDPKVVGLMNLMPDYQHDELFWSPELQSLVRVLEGLEGHLWRLEQEKEPGEKEQGEGKLESPSVTSSSEMLKSPGTAAVWSMLRV
jgi:hypothetical protein